MRTPGKGSSMVQAPPTRSRLSKHQDALAGARQVGGAGKAVVAGADDDHVPFAGGKVLDGCGEAKFAEGMSGG